MIKSEINVFLVAAFYNKFILLTPSVLPIPKRKYIRKKKKSRKMNDFVANALSHNLWRLRNQLNNLTIITLDIMEVTNPQVHLSSSCVIYLSQPLFYLCSKIAWLQSWKSCWIILSELFFKFLGHMSSIQMANFPWSMKNKYVMPSDIYSPWRTTNHGNLNLKLFKVSGCFDCSAWTSSRGSTSINQYVDISSALLVMIAVYALCLSS